ncbi:MAG: DUF7793 family protein [Acidimicrobiales bacterium]
MKRSDQYPTMVEPQMANESTEIEHQKFRMWLRPDGIVQLVWAPMRELRFEDASACIRAMDTLTGGRRAPLLVDASEVGSQDRAARNEFVRRGDLVSGVALVVTTPLSRLMGNFFIAVSKPIVATRLFEDETTAVTWLKGLST